MAHERFLDPDEIERLFKPRSGSSNQNTWPPIEHAGETYYFDGNVKRGGKEHHKYQALKAGGKHILIHENAVDKFGAALGGHVVIYQARSKPIRDSATWLASRPVRRGSR